MIWLVNIPSHVNVGDNLIYLAEKCLLEDIDYKIMYDSSVAAMRRSGMNPSKIFKSNDLILIQGGGYIGSLWRGANDNMMYLIQNLPDNRIICLPNSFYCYADDVELEEQIINVFNTHQHLTVCLRDNSYFKYVDRVKSLKLLPDTVLSYNFIDLQPKTRKAIFILRHDKELIRPDISKIREWFADNDYQIENVDFIDKQLTIANSKEIVLRKLRQLSSAEIVITDRLHGMISSVVAGTKCFAFDNLTGKVHSTKNLWLNTLKTVKILNTSEDFIKNIDLLNIDDQYFDNSKLIYKELRSFIINYVDVCLI